jgi:hypothetical protein
MISHRRTKKNNNKKYRGGDLSDTENIQPAPTVEEAPAVEAPVEVPEEEEEKLGFFGKAKNMFSGLFGGSRKHCKLNHKHYSHKHCTNKHKHCSGKHCSHKHCTHKRSGTHKRMRMRSRRK